MYRPLSHNEQVIVSRTIYEERGLTGGLAESMFMAYKARAMALDEPEFEIFKESELERKSRVLEKPRMNTRAHDAELRPMDFLEQLEDVSKNDKPSKEPSNCYEWFYGHENVLDARHKRLRVKFFNSPKYRKIVLRPYLEDDVIQEWQLSDASLIGEILCEFHQKYPGTRQGIISYFEILFGDPSGFSYNTAMEREAFYHDPVFRENLLKKLNLPDSLEIAEIRESLKLSALETGAVTVEQVFQWEDCP